MRTVSALGGLVLLIAGIAVVMDRLGPEFDALSALGTYWPIALIALGVIGALRLVARPTVAIIGPLVIIASGCAFLVLTLPPLRAAVLPWVPPMVLVAAGSGILLKLTRTYAEPADEILPRKLLVVQSAELEWPLGVFTLGQLTAIASGYTIDLGQSVPMNGEGRLELTAIMSGLVVSVPAGWQVSLEERRLFGPIRKSTVEQVTADKPAIEIYALTIFGRVRVNSAGVASSA